MPCPVLCTSWERLEPPLRRQITPPVSEMCQDGVRRCRRVVDLGPTVMSWQRFKASCTYQAEPVLSSSLHLHKLQQDFGWGRAGGCKWGVCTWISRRDMEGPLLLMYFYEGAPFGQHLDVTCVSSSMLGNLISEKEAEVERGQLFPTVKPDLFPSCS